ncbi:MAG: transglycosylase SLT domain-containing protein [Cyclobacteriaceae bacterium]|nr:transglycosylase SLT domain-containing protein [Cyclobacteriaceae bacterium]
MFKQAPLILSVTSLVLVLVLFYLRNQPPKEDPIQLADEDAYAMPEQMPVRTKTVTLELPDSLSFAGEPVPMHIIDVRERLDRELHINTYWHNNSIFIFKRANRWLPEIEAILTEEGVPDDFKYLSVIESGLLNVTSPAQAVGFWQFLKPTAKEWGLEVSREVDERYHPLKSTRAACKYLKKAYTKFGSWTLAAASYNMGIRGLENRLEEQRVASYFDLLLNEETSRYVFRILAAKELLNDPEVYGFDIPEKHLYVREDLKKIEITESVDDLVQYALDLGINYKILKKHNPWLRRKTLKVVNGKSYIIEVPANSASSL